MTGFANKKSNLCGHCDQINEKSYLNCFVLIYLSQFSLFEEVKSALQKFRELKEQFTMS